MRIVRAPDQVILTHQVHDVSNGGLVLEGGVALRRQYSLGLSEYWRRRNWSSYSSSIRPRIYGVGQCAKRPGGQVAPLSEPVFAGRGVTHVGYPVFTWCWGVRDENARRPEQLDAWPVRGLSWLTPPGIIWNHWCL
jgi:hypothetical protein